MKDIDILINDAAHDWVSASFEPLCEADLIDAFKAGADAMTRILKMRNPYKWGIKSAILNLKVGQKLKVPYQSEADLLAYRTNASMYKKDGLGIWAIYHEGDDIIVIRTA